MRNMGKCEHAELRTVSWNTKFIEYLLIRKPVKNINLRIKADGTVQVSANRRIPACYIDDFVMVKAQFIIDGLRKLEEHRRKVSEPKLYTDQQKEILHQICREIYPLFVRFQLPYPEVKIRYMTSCWGSCRPQKDAITLNSRLLDVPRKCMEYVVLHEFAHFVHPNHSKQFYDLVSELMPDWKERKEKLKQS